MKYSPETFVHNIKKFVGAHKWALLAACLLGALVLWGPTVYANLSTRHLRYDLDRTAVANVPQRDVAIVFGAGVTTNGTPTPYLHWRINTAVQLYKAHRISKLLMSGDNSSKHYNEPLAMRKLAESEGVPAKDIVLDYAGLNTYDSCYRAHAIFRVKSAILVSQGYHLPRAVMACNGLGVPSIGVDAEHDHGPSSQTTYLVREWISTDKIATQLVFKPHPTALGQPEPIRP